MLYRPRILLASLVFAPLACLLAVTYALCLTSQDVPSAELVTPAPSPGIASTPTPGSLTSPSDLQAPPTEDDMNGSSPEAGAEVETSGENSPSKRAGAGDLETEQGDQTPQSEATPPPPALDASAQPVGPELGSESLDPEIKQATAPALAASLRLTESARKLLGDGRVDDAMRDLARAVSLDPSDAFAYYYLGRAYLTRKNYTQALTFFRRAEIGFNGRSDWTAEALSYEGICGEELGQPTSAAQAYQRALAVAPNNFKARIGYGRLSSVAGPVENVDAPPPDQDLGIPPPDVSDDSAPPEQPPPPPPE